MRERLGLVLDRFFAGGGRPVDSSPMHGRAEAMRGELLARPGPRRFSAAMVWTPPAARGPAQVRRSLAPWRLPRVDQMQVHNLLAWCAHDEVRAILFNERIDVPQITCSPADRGAESVRELAAGCCPRSQASSAAAPGPPWP